MIECLIKNKKIILLVMFSPLIMYIFNVLTMFIFNCGTYLGNFLRYIYEMII